MIAPLCQLAPLLTTRRLGVSVASTYVRRESRMVLDQMTRAAALIAVLGTAVVYGTDVFCAVVLRPAWASVDDRALVTVAGSVHRYGDRRMPVPGVLGVVATAATVALAAVAAHWTQAIAASVALALL